MNYISVENISKGFGDEPLFSGISFGLAKGEKTALIASNGTGKTTIMRILAGIDVPDSGKRNVAEGIRIGMLGQEPEFESSLTLNELINSNHNEITDALFSYEKLLKTQKDEPTAGQTRLIEEASAKVEALQGWDYARRLKQMLTNFGLLNLEQPVFQLSGGQKKRLALAMVLVSSPELLLLDEPTNHLDVDMIEWLEKYLKQQNITFLMVTHDRYFLDRVCNNILELFEGKLYHHKGNYSYYLQKSAEREEAIRVETEKAGQRYKQELDWMRRQPKARTTKSKSRIESFYELKDKAFRQRGESDLKLGMKMSRMGSKVLEMRNVSKSFDGLEVISGFDYMFSKGERIGIIGPNGSGKSTFLNLITADLTPDSGEVISGETVVYGYFTQQSFQFEEDKMVIDVVKDIAEVMDFGDGHKATAMQLLLQFNFAPSMHRQPVSLLSGGEKRRLFLLTVLVKQPNFLLLDEPTNDLDLKTLLTLETFLQHFKGCLLLVSHDRYFLDEVVDQLLVFEGNGKVRGFTGNYSDYKAALEELQRVESQQAKTKEKVTTPLASQNRNKRSYKEQKAYEALELEIEALEIEKAELEQKLNELSNDYQELEKASRRINSINEAIDEKTMRWLELDEIGG